MPAKEERILSTITAGSHAVYEIVEVESGVSVILRSTSEPDRQVLLPKSVLPTLISSLERIVREDS